MGAVDNLWISIGFVGELTAYIIHRITAYIKP
jgi:hypothetical protein